MSSSESMSEVLAGGPPSLDFSAVLPLAVILLLFTVIGGMLIRFISGSGSLLLTLLASVVHLALALVILYYLPNDTLLILICGGILLLEGIVLFLVRRFF